MFSIKQTNTKYIYSFEEIGIEGKGSINSLIILLPFEILVVRIITS